VAADDSTIHRAAQAAGRRARESQRQRARSLRVPALREKLVRAGKERLQAEGVPEAALIIEADGWMARERGPDWGLDRQKTGERVAWREVKTAIVFESQNPREKSVLTHVGKPAGLGPRLKAEALRRGETSAAKSFWISDGAQWLWGMRATYFPQTAPLLDFYHAASHVHDFAKAAKGEGKAAKELAGSLLSDLRHGGEDRARRRMGCVLGQRRRRLGREFAGRKTMAREVNYFRKHKGRLCYESRELEGSPVGSGAVESTCAELQGRFKRPGQFWSAKGREKLMALEEARRCRDWNELWFYSHQLN
jgi:hypothetical protein